MSQAFYDYEALEQLLEERERDLELAARIGQTLLEKNRELATQVIIWSYFVYSPYTMHDLILSFFPKLRHKSHGIDLGQIDNFICLMNTHG